MWRFLLSLPLLLPLAETCTYFEVPQKGEAGLAIGRSMELGDLIGDMHWRVVVRPRGKPNIWGPHAGTSKLGFVSIDGSGFKKILPRDGLPLVTEGINEKGLSVSANTFHASEYQEAKPSQPSVSWFEVVPYLLSSFENVTAALEGLRAVAVVGPEIGVSFVCGIGACLHWAIADASGHSAIVEYVKGQLMVYEGRKQHVGVMTNDPALDWQLTNLNQFLSLNPSWPSSNSGIEQTLDSGVFPKPVGHGFNLLGLPGDPTPASRFVRAFYLREYALSNLGVSSKEDAIKLVTGILNNVYLVKGAIAKQSSLTDALEYTPWASIKFPKLGLFMYRSAADMSWKQVSLSQLDFSETAQEATLPISQTDLGIQDVTENFKPSTSVV